MIFNKQALDIPQQLEKLQSRGLIFADKEEAEHYLRFIGYYRLSAYALPLQDCSTPQKRFKSNVTFNDILNLYRFDRELRLLAMDAIERIEVALRSTIVNEMCVSHGPHWYTESRHFHAGFSHGEMQRKIQNQLGISKNGVRPSRPHNEVYINHYYEKYKSPDLPPAWMIAELMSLGVWSQIYANLADSVVRKKVSDNFSVNHRVLKSWMHALTYLRNLCAHHARVWNRQMVIKPRISKGHSSFITNNSRFYVMAVIMADLLNRIAPGTGWPDRLKTLLNDYPSVDPAALGFPDNWLSEKFWKSNSPTT